MDPSQLSSRINRPTAACVPFPQLSSQIDRSSYLTPTTVPQVKPTTHFPLRAQHFVLCMNSPPQAACRYHFPLHSPIGKVHIAKTRLLRFSYVSLRGMIRIAKNRIRRFSLSVSLRVIFNFRDPPPIAVPPLCSRKGNIQVPENPGSGGNPVNSGPVEVDGHSSFSSARPQGLVTYTPRGQL